MATHVALLRGINVGGRNRLKMAALIELFTAAGCTNVRTLIQSGNVVFDASAKLAARVGSAVSEALEKRLGSSIPLVLRRADELVAAAARNPFLKRGVNPDELHLAFLVDAPDKARGAALDPQRSPGDAFALRGRDLYLHLPDGVARTKLTNAYLDRTLGTVSSLRNWHTVLKLVELASPPR